MDSAYLKTHKKRLIHQSKVSDWKVNFPDGFRRPSCITLIDKDMRGLQALQVNFSRYD